MESKQKAMEAESTDILAVLTKKIERLEKARYTPNKQPPHNANKRNTTPDTTQSCNRCGSNKHTVKDCGHKHQDATCTKCKKKGHFVTACTSASPKKDKDRGGLYCSKCNKRGHSAETCRTKDTHSNISQSTNHSNTTRKSHTTHASSSTTASSNKRKRTNNDNASKNNNAGRVGRPAHKK